jgi:hypothetical protein
MESNGVKWSQTESNRVMQSHAEFWEVIWSHTESEEVMQGHAESCGVT